MFVVNNKKYLHNFTERTINVTLGTNITGQFEGTGFVIASTPQTPGFYFPLFPALLAAQDPCCTMTTGGLKKYSGFTSIMHDVGTEMKLTHESGNKFTLPCTTDKTIDFVELTLHPVSQNSEINENLKLARLRKDLHKDAKCNYMCLQPAPTHARSLKGTVELSWRLHICYAHRKLTSIQDMIKKGYVDGIPKNTELVPLPFRCPVCDAATATKIPRGKVKDFSKTPIGTVFHMDFTFFNVISTRGFSSALALVEGTSRRLWFFPTISKNPPIDLCIYFFGWLKKGGINVQNLRCDEDGGLARSTELGEMLFKETNIVLQTTGGYASTINGKAERPHRSVKNMIRAPLMGSNSPDEWWCFCGQYSSVIHNNMLNRMTGKPPLEFFDRKTIPITKLFPFGSHVRVMRDLRSRRALGARTGGDTRELDDISISHEDAKKTPTLYDGKFVGYSNSTAVALVIKEGERADEIQRVHHMIVDMF